MSLYQKARKIKHFAYNSVNFATGYREFQRTGTTPMPSYFGLRGLYVATNGRFNDAFSWVLSKYHPASEVAPGESILGDISDDSVRRIAEDIEKNGFHVFDRKLPMEIVNRLRAFAETIPSRALQTADAAKKDGEFAAKPAPYRQHPVESPAYHIDQRDIVENPTVQQLLMDSGFQRVAQAFLRCAPIVDLVAMWWSRPFHGKASTEAAQLYHFDMDRIKLVKFFFYLTDVTPESGPHCYVRGSSKRKPKPILRDGRIPDEEIRMHHREEDILEICGEIGSIIAVDTRGWHKGKPLTEGERLILQFEFANSMFGQNYPKAEMAKIGDGPFREFVHANPRMFEGVIA